MTDTRKPIVDWDIDEAHYLGDGADGCYWLTAEGPDGKWYVTVVVDSDTGHFVDNMCTDMGPFDVEADADAFGRNAAADWCMTNEVSLDEDENDAD